MWGLEERRKYLDKTGWGTRASTESDEWVMKTTSPLPSIEVWIRVETSKGGVFLVRRRDHETDTKAINTIMSQDHNDAVVTSMKLTSAV